VLVISSFANAAEKQGANQPTYLISGDAQLLSHFIDRGLSMSDKNPAFTASFLFNLGQQFRFGFWGSNISNVTSSDDNLWLKIVGDIRLDISSTAKIFFYIHDDHYYKSNQRNGQEIGLNLEFPTYFYQVELLNNYQGTKTNGEYLRIGKKFPLSFGALTGAVGYSLQHADGYTNYFDLKTTAAYQVTPFFTGEVGITATAGATQFSDRGSTYLYLGLRLAY
jgi:hypothetical protein